MDLSAPPRKPKSESIVPMINVVFLLLIFFLMTSQIAPPEPFEVTIPNAQSGAEAGADHTLYLDKTGLIHFEGQDGDAAIAHLHSLGASAIRVRADAQVEARILAATLKGLTVAGLTRVELVVAPK